MSKDGLSNKCKECAAAYARQRYQKNKDRIKERSKKWIAENPEKRKRVLERYAEKHKESEKIRKREYHKRVRKLFPEKVRLLGRIAAHKRRVAVEKAGPMPPKDLFDLVLKAARGRCVYCGCVDQPLTLDHLSPVSKGGSNRWDNFIPCCKSCNSSKKDKAPEEWLYKCRGVPGLLDAVVFLKSVAKAVKRMFPDQYGLYVSEMMRDLFPDE